MDMFGFLIGGVVVIFGVAIVAAIVFTFGKSIVAEGVREGMKLAREDERSENARG